MQLGVFSVEDVGLRRGLRGLRIRAGRHELYVFATPDGVAARVTAEIDGKKLVRQRKPRPFRVWSRDLQVMRWVIAAASETYRSGRPRWTCEEIARNLKKNSGTHAVMTGESVRRTIWRLSPGLAEHRGNYFRTKPAERPTLARRGRSQKDTEHRAAVKAAQVDELRRAGLL